MVLQLLYLLLGAISSLELLTTSSCRRYNIYYVTMDEMNAQLRPNFLAVISGSTGCGKSQLAKQLVLTTSLWQKYPEHIVISYQASRQDYHDIPNATLVCGTPDFNKIKPNSLVIIDDCTVLCKQIKSELINLFCIKSRHSNISVMIILHNPFLPEFRTARLQAQYHFFFANLTDSLYINTFAHRSHPGKAHVFLDAFNLATSHPYSYLFYDASPECPRQHRLRSHITDIPQFVYNNA